MRKQRSVVVALPVARGAAIAEQKRAAVLLRIRLGDAEVSGIDDVRIGDDGRITSMTVHWRPLEEIVAIQQKLAPLVGVPALQLVELNPS